ncbi:MAG: ATP-binding protein [Terrisporobacter othiniensis]|uniref:histidine kinase n=2 Tax=Terrisporobacter TaxID=1505652 RepID=A0AAX2ZED8_9FIRM|nr:MULTISPECIES: HAMP domain-containing sensor histidine kinase [Terrisporobacter]MBN9646582.1 HAMP domain-containing sensor histidine kinase [Terrisporobacter glycolicus]MDU4859481.1 ATP-binding protein [Terrisporobacter othiniensis]MDU6993868.1 ATP-binding protein [Terrisporobacter othiniensis]UEL46767.1 HAMP domain-containing sensor histidine kinase [Terrisporobacter hibernicus]SFJ01052.1 two-component system, OmpR family, phosphate regulon sensor histidine kinase PhoR [Terrisporobacter gly
MEPISGIYFFVMLLACSVAILLYRYTITIRRFLKSFIKLSKKVSNKEFHSRLQTSARGELGELTRNFNFMMETMENTIEEVEYKHLQLTSVLKSISHGIIVIDIDGNIILINDEARRMIKSKCNGKEDGKNLKQVINVDDILKGVERYIGSKENHSNNVTLDDETVYRIKIDPVYLQNSKNAIIGSIINIEDITEIVKLENMRRDFVANVSHELKTPLTSINGFVETLIMNEDLPVNKRNRFLAIIQKESDRLKRLIEDILLLSSIESKNNLVMENIILYDVFKEVYEMINYIANSKKIDLQYNFEDKEAVVQAYGDYLKQLLLNLIDNAIKYTPEGGRVTVNQFTKNDEIVIEVIDNGVGIPKEDQSKIFQRFYRVDKARSRSVGGTGLGLAITKHIVHSLKGSIGLESQLGEGSKFIVKLPKKIS